METTRDSLASTLFASLHFYLTSAQPADTRRDFALVNRLISHLWSTSNTAIVALYMVHIWNGLATISSTPVLR